VDLQAPKPPKERLENYDHLLVRFLAVWKHKVDTFRSQNHLKDVDKTKTTSDSTPVADENEVEVDFFGKMADVRLVLVVLDVLLVVHRLTVLCLDVRCLNTRPSQQPSTEATHGEVNSQAVDTTAKSTTEVRPEEDKQSLIHLKTDLERRPIAGSQSQCSSWSRDHHTCSTMEDISSPRVHTTHKSTTEVRLEEDKQCLIHLNE